VRDEVRRRAASFAEAAAEFLALVEKLDQVQWHAASVEDGRPIGTIAHHVALGHAIGHLRVIAAASGYPQPTQQGSAVARNAAHAAGTPAPDRDTTLLLLRTGAAALEAAIRCLRDDQLDAEITVGPVTATIGRLVSGTREHVLEHTATVRRSV
jgi:DinB family protein